MPELSRLGDYLTGPVRSLSSHINRMIASRQASLSATYQQGPSTEIGFSASVSPTSSEPWREMRESYDRRRIIADVRRMIAENPLIAQAADTFVDTAVSKGCTITVETTAARGVRAGEQRAAQRVIDDVYKDCDLRTKIPSWGRMLMAEGDLFTQRIEKEQAPGVVGNAKRMPAASMIRHTDARDSFMDVLDAYRQIDTASEQVVARYALWQISHSRWNWIDGERYGNSQFLQLRSMSRRFLNMLQQMEVRRRTRGPGRRLFTVGTPEKPQGWDEVKKFKELNSMTELDRQGKLLATLDYFGNGLTDVKEMHADPKLGDIEDVLLQLNVLFPRTCVAKGLLGFGENVSRDILDEQREFLYTAQDLLIDVLEYGQLRPLMDLALMMRGLNPDAIVYNVAFEDRMSEAMKLKKLEVLHKMVTSKPQLMTPAQFAQRAAAYLNIKDVEQYVQQLEEYQEKERGLQMEMLLARAHNTRTPNSGAPNNGTPNNGKDDPAYRSAAPATGRTKAAGARG